MGPAKIRTAAHSLSASRTCRQGKTLPGAAKRSVTGRRDTPASAYIVHTLDTSALGTSSKLPRLSTSRLYRGDQFLDNTVQRLLRRLKTTSLHFNPVLRRAHSVYL